MVNRVLFSSTRQDWETPQALFDELDAKYHFNLDPCSTDSNAKCEKHFTKRENGLLQDWGGRNVFVNPPYGRSDTEKWVHKAYKESQKLNTTVVMLLPARTDTKWFHDYVYHKSEIVFIKGRIKFELGGKRITDAQGRAASAPFPSMIVIYRGVKG